MSRSDRSQVAKGLPGMRWMPAVLMVGLVATILLRSGAGEDSSGQGLDGPPEAVVGLWSTDDERYAGRFIRITPDEVELGLGGDAGVTEGRIVKVTSWTEGGFEVVRVQYAIPGGEDVLEITLHGVDRMRLRNPPEVVWTRH